MHQFKLINNFDNTIQYESVVGMAVYAGDRLPWVEQAMDSILKQSYHNYLLVVVIDGQINIDILTFLLESARRNVNIVLFEGKQNFGLSTCMNHIIDWSLPRKPKYFFRMDADDISEPERLATQVKYLELHPQVSVLGSALVEIDEKGLKVGQRKLPLFHNEIVNFLPKRCSINHPTVVIRFEVFEAGYRYRENLRNTQDYFLWADLSSAGFKFANLAQSLLKFRRVNDFYKRRGLDKSVNEFKARFYTMKKLGKYSIGNIFYAFAVLGLRLMPPTVVKLAYKIDRYYLSKWVKSE
jgi:glycosyltransferase involved in cell wall biosynthesis